MDENLYMRATPFLEAVFDFCDEKCNIQDFFEEFAATGQKRDLPQVIKTLVEGRKAIEEIQSREYEIPDELAPANKHLQSAIRNELISAAAYISAVRSGSKRETKRGEDYVCRVRDDIEAMNREVLEVFPNAFNGRN